MSNVPAALDQTHHHHHHESNEEFAQALIPDLPLLMHGSGDVIPSEVDSATTSLLAHLTANYVYNLVQAAVDAHDILTDGAGGVLPPPQYSHDPKSELVSGTKRARDEDWELSLPVPKIRRNGDQESEKSESQGSPTVNKISLQEWKGVQGVDIYSDRIRRPYASHPSTIGVQSFIFPICHDAQLYNRLQEVRKTMKELSPLLVNNQFADAVSKEEETFDFLGESVFHWIGAGELWEKNKDTDSRILTGTLTDGSQDSEGIKAKRREFAKRLSNRSRVALAAKWPGVGNVLPTHSSLDFVNNLK